MKNSPLISIIIPTRIEKELPFCLKSLKNQTYLNKEISIVRDINKRGACWARNQGLKKAKGKYLFFCDDDIELNSKVLEIFVSALENSKTSFAYCNYKRKGRLEGIVKSIHWNTEELKKRNYISTMSLVKAKDFPKEGFDENLKRFQDWDLWLTMAEQGKYGIYINQVLFTAYYKEGDISCNKINIEESTHIVRKKHINYYSYNKKTMTIFTNDISKKTRDSLEEKRDRENEGKINEIIPEKRILETKTKEVKLELGGKAPVYSDGSRKHIDTYAFPHTEYKVDSFSSLPFEDNSVDEIFGKRILQRLKKEQAIKALREWHRVLKPHSKITLVCVDLKNSMGKFLQSYQESALELIFGNQQDGTEFYLSGYTKEILIKLIKEVGFDEVKAIMPQVDYYDPSIEFIIEGVKK